MHVGRSNRNYAYLRMVGNYRLLILKKDLKITIMDDGQCLNAYNKDSWNHTHNFRGTVGTRTPTFLEWEYRTPHFSGAWQKNNSDCPSGGTVVRNFDFQTYHTPPPAGGVWKSPPCTTTFGVRGGGFPLPVVGGVFLTAGGLGTFSKIIGWNLTMCYTTVYIPKDTMVGD